MRAALVGFVAVLTLTGCDTTVDRAPVTVTQTVEAEPEPTVSRPAGDPELCETIRMLRDTNKRLYDDGYADDYSAEYDQQLRAAGC